MWIDVSESALLKFGNICNFLQRILSFWNSWYLRIAPAICFKYKKVIGWWSCPPNLKFHAWDRSRCPVEVILKLSKNSLCSCHSFAPSPRDARCRPFTRKKERCTWGCTSVMLLNAFPLLLQCLKVTPKPQSSTLSQKCSQKMHSHVIRRFMQCSFTCFLGVWLVSLPQYFSFFSYITSFLVV